MTCIVCEHHAAVILLAYIGGLYTLVHLVDAWRRS